MLSLQIRVKHCATENSQEKLYLGFQSEALFVFHLDFHDIILFSLLFFPEQKGGYLLQNW